jgi:hypothetical protein
MNQSDCFIQEAISESSGGFKQGWKLFPLSLDSFSSVRTRLSVKNTKLNESQLKWEISKGFNGMKKKFILWTC